MTDRAIGPPLTFAERTALVDSARQWLGVRWRHQGRDRDGVDCGGLLVVAMRGIGRTMRDKRAYGRVPKDGWLEAALAANFGPPGGVEDIALGRIALFRFGKSEPDHVGILACHPQGGLSVIHAYAPWRRVVEHRLDDGWRSRLTGVYVP